MAGWAKGRINKKCQPLDEQVISIFESTRGGT